MELKHNHDSHWHNHSLDYKQTVLSINILDPDTLDEIKQNLVY